MFAASNPADLEPNLAQFLTVDAGNLGQAAQEMGDEAFREIHASIKQDYRPEGVLTDMQAQKILIGVGICLYHLPFDHLTGSLPLCP